MTLYVCNRWFVCSVVYCVFLVYTILADLPAARVLEDEDAPVPASEDGEGEVRNGNQKFFFLQNDFHVKLNKSSAMFTLYTLNCQIGEKLLIDKSIINKTCFNPKNELKVLIHGYTEKGHSINSMVPIRLAYFRAKREVNVLMVDWSLHSIDGNYVNSVRHLEEVGKYVARFIYYTYQTTAFRNMSKVHMIGFSLGAHVSGLASRNVHKLTGQKVGRITGLDPAGPTFHMFHTKDRLTTNDSDFLDIIHGDTDTFGGNFKGHANFYPNGSKKQPGCLSVFAVFIGCGHRRVPQWFAESVLYPRRFIGCRCADYQSFTAKKCSCVNRNDVGLMGESCTLRTRGTFYLEVKQATHMYVLGIYPSLISFGFSSSGKINNTTVPALPLEEVFPTIPSFNFSALDVPAPTYE